MRVRLVTTWDQPCGIAEHAKALVAAVQAADPEIQFQVETDLHPQALQRLDLRSPDVVLLNYHAALHSQWTPKYVEAIQMAGIPVVITYHDSGVPNSDQCKALHAVADRFIVHEPVEDLPGAIYVRQGVPAHAGVYEWGWGTFGPRAYRDQPLLGTVGFPFPWKNYDLLVAATARAGWALLLLAPGATEAQIATWRVSNPYVLAVPDFIPADTVVAYLAGCDATAFLYMCANTGTSGAIRQGLAARKPVLATRDCRQFRDLQGDPVGGRAITWLDDLSVEGVATALETVRIERVDPGIVRLAEQDSWVGIGRQYAGILRGVCAHGFGVEQSRGQQP